MSIHTRSKRCQCGSVIFSFKMLLNYLDIRVDRFSEMVRVICKVNKLNDTNHLVGGLPGCRVAVLTGHRDGSMG